MEDKLIEVWQKEFINLMTESGCVDYFLEFNEKEFKFLHVNDKWQGFLMAKQSQPVVELPDHIILTLVLGDTVPLLTKSDVIEVLQSAGIPFKVRGE